tara:strand:- start:1145 stop:1348 length:204 start_codon:yes stop_codon:yes gene_type:complete
MTSFKPVFLFQHGDERQENNQRFATYDEAKGSAMARYMRWTMPSGWDVETSTDEPNYTHMNGVDEHL